jgi:hypothetical protein
MLVGSPDVQGHALHRFHSSFRSRLRLRGANRKVSEKYEIAWNWQGLR